jgi:hypothetical protein
MKTSLRLAAFYIMVTAPGAIRAQGFDSLTEPHAAPIEVIHGKPFVQVEINGKGPFRFLVDTGTSGDAMVTPQLAAQLDLPPAGEARLDDPSGPGSQELPVRKLDTLRVAGIDFYAIKAIQHPIPINTSCDGILGFKFFRDFLLTLDYVNHRLVLAEGELTPDGEKSVLSFRMPDGVPIVGLKIGNQDVEAMVDSGGSGLSLPDSLIPRVRLSAQPVLFGEGQSLFAVFQIRVARLATDVKLGDLTFDQPWVEIHRACPIPNFGSFPLQHFIVTFDQENKLVRLDGPSKRITLDIPPLPMTVIFQPENGDPALIPVG